MAIGSTIYKVQLNIANMDTHYYQNHDLTVALHPSETEERFMMRLIAFIYHASESLQFTKGISTDDEPDLWQKSLSDEIELWIDLGQPDEKRIRKACARAQHVNIYTYHEHKAKPWREQNKAKFKRFNNLNIIQINSEKIENMVQRSMTLQCNIQDSELFLSNTETASTITLTPYEF